VLRYHDGGWRRYDVPAKGGALAVVLAHGDAWVVVSNPRNRHVSLHWTGRSWIREFMLPWRWESPSALEYPMLMGLSIGQRGPVWAVFIVDTGNCCYPLMVTVRHGGSSWTEPARVGIGTPSGIVTDATGRTATVVGSYYGPEYDYGVLDSWDGTEWIRQRVEGEPVGWSEFTAVDTDGAGGRWAVGGHYSGRPVPLVAYQCQPLRTRN
jgi:hypothetical protein